MKTYKEKLKEIFGIENDSELEDFTITADMAIHIHKKLEKDNAGRSDIHIKIVNKSTHGYGLPEKMTAGSAGIDLRSDCNVTLLPNFRSCVPTGLYIQLPVGYEAQIRPRSGLAIKHGVTVLNSPGTIDADYRGEILVMLINLSSDEYFIEKGERIAQMVINKIENFEWDLVENLDPTDRKDGGFGHTGKK